MNYTGSNPPNDSPPNPNTKAVAIIPARYDSVRLPGKALLEIAGKPMICRVVERALAARNVARAIVATDDERIFAAVKSAGYEAAMTRTEHRSGTDRIAEIAAGLDDVDIIVNVQGDEPLIAPLTIERAVEAMGQAPKSGSVGHRSDGNDVGIVTTWEPMESAADVLNPDIVKIVVDDCERAVYFSRSLVPYPRDAVRRHGSIQAAIFAEPALLSSFRKHTGLYVYRREVLLQFAGWPQSRLERLESLEQLRALERGVVIRAIEASTPSIGVDTVEDLEKVRAIVSSSRFQVSSSL
ncbi:MAG TPA: 3-deoxy-manno-octulosonate cytidylyltransferase [Pyrinomonadaceae bacterium]